MDHNNLSIFYRIGICFIGIYVFSIGFNFFAWTVLPTIKSIPDYVRNFSGSNIGLIFFLGWSTISLSALTVYWISGIFIILRKNWARIAVIISSIWIFLDLMILELRAGTLLLPFIIFYIGVFVIPILFLIHPRIKVLFK